MNSIIKNIYRAQLCDQMKASLDFLQELSQDLDGSTHSLVKHIPEALKTREWELIFI